MFKKTMFKASTLQPSKICRMTAPTASTCRKQSSEDLNPLLRGPGIVQFKSSGSQGFRVQGFAG